MKKYNTEFKSMIVELYKTGHSVKELSREYKYHFFHDLTIIFAYPKSQIDYVPLLNKHVDLT